MKDVHSSPPDRPGAFVGVVHRWCQWPLSETWDRRRSKDVRAALVTVHYDRSVQ